VVVVVSVVVVTVVVGDAGQSQHSVTGSCTQSVVIGSQIEAALQFKSVSLGSTQTGGKVVVVGPAIVVVGPDKVVVGGGGMAT
jgi:hypothetical protein